MTKFTNRSLTYTATILMIWLSVLVMTLFVVWVTLGSVFMTQIFKNLDQNSLILLVVELILLATGIYLLVLIPVKNYIYKAYLILDDKGVELQYINLKFQLQNEKWKWKEITEVTEKIGNTEYEFSINTKNTQIKIPQEIYQNTLRVNQIKKAFEKYNIPTNYSHLARTFLLTVDILMSFALVIVLLFSLLFLVSQFL
jgi:hypothetical protein